MEAEIEQYLRGIEIEISETTIEDMQKALEELNSYGGISGRAAYRDIRRKILPLIRKLLYGSINNKIVIPRYAFASSMVFDEYVGDVIEDAVEYKNEELIFEILQTEGVTPKDLESLLSGTIDFIGISFGELYDKAYEKGIDLTSIIINQV